MSSPEVTNNGQHANGSSGSPDTGATNSHYERAEGFGTPQLSSEVREILYKVGSAAERSIDLSFVDMEENEARLIGEAIASSEHLEELALQMDSMSVPYEQDENHPRPSDIVLSTAFLGPRSNVSVRTLIIQGSATDGDLMWLGVLPRVIRETSHLTRLEFRWRGDDGTSRNETRELFDSLLHNSTIRTLVLPSLVRWDFEDSDDGGFIDAETFSSVVNLVKENKVINHLDLLIGECRGPGSEDLNLPAFYTELGSNSILKTLHLRENFVTRDAESEFLKWISTTESLEELHLDSLYEFYGDDEEVPLRYKLFFRALRDNKSLKKLVLEGLSVQAEEDFSELMDAITTNSGLQEIIFEPESERGQAVREALQSRVAHERDTET